jgi:hypothetical protein
MSNITPEIKKVYLVQINVTYSSTIAYLPYAAGCLAAYAWNDEEIKNKFELADILCIRHKPEENLERIKNPSVVGFSCYVWNMEYNLLLARMIKEKTESKKSLCGTFAIYILLVALLVFFAFELC